MSNRKFPGSAHNHTDYSNIRIRDSINRVNDLLNYAGELGHEFVAITDHEFTGSWMKVEQAAKKIKSKYPDLKVLRGNEIYLCRNGLNANNFNKDTDKYYHFILIAKDAVGAKQIMELSTRAWNRSYMARGMRRVPTYYQDLIDIIGANPGHVIGSTACLGGALSTQLLKYKETKSQILFDKIILWCQQIQNLFGAEDFYLELQPSESNEQTYVNRMLIKLANDYGFQYIITTDSHYLKKEDAAIHAAYLNAQNGDREVASFYATTYMMSTEELESHLDLTEEELEKAYNTIRKLYNSCTDFSLAKPLRIPQLPWIEHICDSAPSAYYDRIPFMKTFMESDYIGDRKLCEAIVAGIESHPDLQNQQAYDEINSNLEITWTSSKVNNAHWSAYFLNLQKIIDLCWEANSLVGPGRGSGVGFILLYVLGITQINPLRETTKCYPWRFLNPDRVSVLDVDFDIEGGRRSDVMKAFRTYYGNDRVANVATFRTEKSKSAILTAARGLGIDVDIAQYIASLIPADRGALRTLSQVFYGDEENDWAPITQFVNEMTINYPELWEVAQKIEGLICGSGVHAGGVIFVDEPFTESCALMRAPDGTICTQFELHDAEAASLIKYDALSVEAMDKLHICLDLLAEDGLINEGANLRELYENVIGIYKLERNDPKMWEMVWNHEIQSLFQMEKQSGIQGIALSKPTSVDDLATLNSVIRLMAQEKGAEQPLNKFARFKANINEWYREMEEYGLTLEEMKILEPHLLPSNGICESQEGFMMLVQIPECGGFDLTWADRLRKSIAKKNPAEYEQLTKEYMARVEERGLSRNLCNYVWNVLVATSRGYGFNKSHTLAYSLIALQEMNLAFRFPIMYWNCACLISDAGGDESNEDDEEVIDNVVEENYVNEMEEFTDEDNEDDVDDEYAEDEDCDGFPVDVKVMKDGKKKKKVKATNYGRIAAAIGKIKQAGCAILPPQINHSTYTFSPDIANNAIIYGLSGITRIGDELIHQIIENRPYSSLEDLLNKVKLNKPQMINLIKSGALDCFGDRLDVMHQYINMISDTKKRITLQNMKMLIDFGLIPSKYELQCRVYNFSKYLKKMKLDSTYYGLDNIAFAFYEKEFSIDDLVPGDTESGFKIKQTVWEKHYQEHMDIVRPYVKANSAELLIQVNDRLTRDMWDKYCKGTISQWEMESISCYIHEHELENVDMMKNGLEHFDDLPLEPEIERVIPIKGKQVPIFKLSRIAGTVLDRDKAKKTVTLLTTDGVVTVKIFGGVFAQYDKQLSERSADGKKHVIEKSTFSRGNKIIVIGLRDGDSFRAKKYSRTPYHLVEKIVEVGADGSLRTAARAEQ